jgi:hypothetical protein
MAQGKIDVTLDADQVGIIAQPKPKTQPTVGQSHAHSRPEVNRQTLSELIERIRLAAVVQTP